MADEPNKEFTIQVNFSGVEKAILGDFKKQINDVADAINTIAAVMERQITALENIQRQMNQSSTTDSLGGLGLGFGSGNRPPTGPGAHLAGGAGGGGVDMSALVRELQTLNSNLERSGGGGTNMWGRRGGSGYSQWDQENSFEIPQQSNARFTFQDVARQAGSIGGGRWRDAKTGLEVTRQDMADRQAKYRADPNRPTTDDYFDAAYSEGSPNNPFRKQWAEINSRSNFARTELGVERGRFADSVDKFDAASPFFGRGGVFNPNTYMNPFRKLAGIGGTLGRFGMQFGNDQTFNPFSDSGRQVGGAIWDNLSMSWGGLNPYLSGKQAREITTAVAGMGYSQDVGHDMRHMMGDVTQHSNIGIDTQAQIIDKSFRWGTANLKELASVMKNDIPQAAQAARMNVGQFSQQLDQVATAMTGTRGVNYYTSLRQTANLSAGTGINPGDAQAVFDDPVLQWTATQIRYQKTGEFSFGRTQVDPNLATYMSQAVVKNMGRLFGIGTVDQLLKWKDAKPGENGYSQYSQFLTQLELNPGMIPGITTPQDLYKWTPAKIRHTAAVDWITNASTEADAASADAIAHYHEGDSFGGFLKTGSAEHSLLTKAVNALGGTSGKTEVGKRAADKKLLELVQGSGGRKKFIHDLLNLDSFTKEQKMEIAGHHTVYDNAGGIGYGARGPHHEAIGDSHRHLSDMVAAAKKTIVGNVAKENNKGSNVKITLSMSPELQRMFNVQMGGGGGAQAVASGAASAPTANPNTGMVDETYNTHG